jgi:uncharacterized protein (DUF1810 family)
LACGKLAFERWRGAAAAAILLINNEQARRLETQGCSRLLEGLALADALKPRNDDPYNLARVVDAQDRVFAQALLELRKGEKHGHWMWFIFPQIAGLGHSETARIFAISSRGEAEAYLQHAVLGPRLRECSRAVNLVEGRSAHDIFDDPDELKFRSSMTLFANVATDERVFEQALEKFFGGRPDALTLRKLAALDQGGR